MKVEVFALCDAATDFMGKLNLLGTFDTISAGQSPVVHAGCAVAIRLRFERIESGEHRLRMNLVNEDGHLVVPPLEAGINVQVAEGMPSSAINLVVNFQNLKFEEFGDYAVDLAIDGRHEASLPLFVRRMETQPLPPPPLGL